MFTGQDIHRLYTEEADKLSHGDVQFLVTHNWKLMWKEQQALFDALAARINEVIEEEGR